MVETGAETHKPRSTRRNPSTPQSINCDRKGDPGAGEEIAPHTPRGSHSETSFQCGRMATYDICYRIPVNAARGKFNQRRRTWLDHLHPGHWTIPKPIKNDRLGRLRDRGPLLIGGTDSQRFLRMSSHEDGQMEVYPP